MFHSDIFLKKIKEKMFLVIFLPMCTVVQFSTLVSFSIYRGDYIQISKNDKI